MAFDKLAVIAIVAIAALSLGISAIGGDPPDSPPVQDTYSITYVLNGGTNSDANPSEYTHGTQVTLQNAVKDDCVFEGWFTDSGLTEGIGAIPADSTGDITLYASWSPLVGNGFELSVSGTRSERGIHYDISGSVEYMYLYRSGDRYFISCDSSLTYRYSIGMFNFSREIDNHDTYWSGNSDVVWTSAGTAVLETADGSKTCERFDGVGEDGHTETQYIGDGWIPYLMVYEYRDQSTFVSMTYTFVRTVSFVPEDDFQVTAVGDMGVVVSGSGTYEPGSDVTLTADVADGTVFSGWYDDSGNLLSEDATYVVTELYGDLTIYAVNATDPDLTPAMNETTHIDSGMTLTDAEWTVADSQGVTVNTVSDDGDIAYAFETPGTFTISVSGTDADGKARYMRITVFVDGEVRRTFVWQSGGRTYTCILDILYSDYLDYKDSNVLRRDVNAAADRAFVTYEDEYIMELATYIESATVGLSDIEVANCILAFTQYIEYQSDDEYMGQSEYWKFPLETLFDEGGDCEDTSILFSAIAKAMGYDTAIVLLPGHMASGIALDGVDGYCFHSDDSVEYYYCETTATGYSVGDNPNSTLYNDTTAEVYVI